MEDGPATDGAGFDADDVLDFLVDVDVLPFSDDVVSALGTTCMKMGKCPTEIP